MFLNEIEQVNIILIIWWNKILYFEFINLNELINNIISQIDKNKYLL